MKCHKHDEPSAGTCRTCILDYCDHCLVYAFGRAKPPYCIDCALSAFGVRAVGTNDAPSVARY